ncbi:MAG: hypothetical protein KDE20_05430 [Caldilineaceae bacterium]|nr:hypothetical protein [Caldilineaceae bacterium]
MKSRIFVVSVFVVAIIGSLHLYAGLLTNATWLSIRAHIRAQQGSPWALQLAPALLQIAPTDRQRTQQANFVAGVLAELNGGAEEALSAWQKAPAYSQRLIDLGRAYQAAARMDDALLFFRGATGDTIEHPAGFRLIGVCQRLHAAMSQDDRANRGFCDTIFEQNGGNLLANPDFAGGTVDGWLDHTRAASVDSAMGVPPPSVTISGLPEENGQGIYQWVTFRPETRVHFSALVYIDGKVPEDLRLLYVGRQTLDGKAAGNGQTLEASVRPGEWLYVERSLTLPEAQDSLFRFVPVLLNGEGTVRLDDVRLEVQSVP